MQCYSQLLLPTLNAAASADGVPYATSAQAFAYNSGIIQDFLNAPEFTSAHPNISNSDLVTPLYTDELGRTPSATELSYYVNELNAGVAKTAVIGTITGSPEAIAHPGVWIN